VIFDTPITEYVEALSIFHNASNVRTLERIEALFVSYAIFGVSKTITCRQSR
jgi:hypothetical protein